MARPRLTPAQIAEIERRCKDIAKCYTRPIDLQRKNPAIYSAIIRHRLYHILDAMPNRNRSRKEESA